MRLHQVTSKKKTKRIGDKFKTPINSSQVSFQEINKEEEEAKRRALTWRKIDPKDSVTLSWENIIVNSKRLNNCCKKSNNGNVNASTIEMQPYPITDKPIKTKSNRHQVLKNGKT